jgi:hypothetical protein
MNTYKGKVVTKKRMITEDIHALVAIILIISILLMVRRY